MPRLNAANSAGASHNVLLLIFMLLCVRKTYRCESVLLKRVRELWIRDEVPIAQGFEEGDQRRLLRRIEVPRAKHTAVQVGMSFDVSAIVIDHVFQRRQAAVVHVGSGELDVA